MTKKSTRKIIQTISIAHEYSLENLASSVEYIISSDKEPKSSMLARSVRMFMARRSILFCVRYISLFRKECATQKRCFCSGVEQNLSFKYIISLASCDAPTTCGSLQIRASQVLISDYFFVSLRDRITKD